MYDESLFLRAPASVKGEEGRALLVTRKQCVFDVGVRILLLCVWGRVGWHLFFVSSPETRCLPSVMLPSPTSVTLEPPPEQRIYKLHDSKQRMNSIWFVFHKGGGQVLAESQNAQIQVKPDDLND